jgi:hypothetical protein
MTIKTFLFQGISRILQIQQFQHWLCQKMPQSGLKMNSVSGKIEFDPEKKMALPNNDDDENKENGVAAQGNKAQMMENMAQLWLQQEVRDLEIAGSHEVNKRSPYLIIDHLVMVKDFFKIKDIVASKRFAVIVPSAGTKF